MLPLLRTFIYCWLAAALLGCSLPHPLPNDPIGRGEIGIQSAATAKTTPVNEGEAAAPSTIQAQDKDLPHIDEIRATGLAEKKIGEDANLKEQRKVADEISTGHQQPNSASDDDLIDLWRNDM